MHLRHFLPILVLLLAGCEQLGLDTAAKEAAAAAVREADGKAIGGACRHAGRALEDCYLMNPKASKAAIFAGWRDFDAYMRENKLEIVRPEGEEPEPKDDAAEGKKAGTKHGAAAAKPFLAGIIPPSRHPAG
ncbi:MAG: hypothetical protein OHM77_06665 [Candidatus Nitricoxidivorans perseverans]|uniref:Uncharacterized protein n=1 Tax=Candidatus Nitricoxidivorans perseverans TaxID=2975601 RepID=A0AA49IZN1_9PROT|nr:MAG: hypothetical protein OHM77_06665 [Candidatus Nitricoxidivorans perseverans]